ncbi:putative ATP-dependent RNA helicase SoYb isoform X2 [Drosophila grimshawi]|uniref:putative ATP-dependent RNA helicase SoYb isoform X2 n=1 Tax=Drosophila grimshawi TaxID=7222 RepID=UPI000C8714BC|nr:putative ATP-dependent RNA helicase SoYb isoform X2 [Drosophila grimshawi]
MSACNSDKCSQNQLEDKNQPLAINPEEGIVITHYVNPHLFCYTTWLQLAAGGVRVNRMESQLSPHCHVDNQREFYVPDQHVIVSRCKLLRGLVIVGKHAEYLVWALDYGFFIKCQPKDMWLLPPSLCQKHIHFQWGGVAHVAPNSGTEWSNRAVRLLDQRLLEAQLLVYKNLYQNEEQHNNGQLLIKSAQHGGTFVDAASYLVDSECGRPELSSEASTRAVYDKHLLELNHSDIETSCCSTVFMELVERLFSKMPDMLDVGLDPGAAPKMPESAKRLTKVKSCNDSVVETALIGGSRKSTSGSSSNSSNWSLNSFDASVDPMQAKPATAIQIKRYNLEMFRQPRRNEEKSTKLKENPCVLNLIEEDRKNVKSDCQSSATRQESLEKHKIIQSETNNQLESHQKLQANLEQKYNQFGTSTGAYYADKGLIHIKEEPQMHQASIQEPDALQPNKIDQPVNNIQAELVKKLADQTDKVEGKQANKKSNKNRQTLSKSIFEGIHNETSSSLNCTNLVLAHSTAPVAAMRSWPESQLCANTMKALVELKLLTALPTQLYAWPHLMAGNSLVLIDRIGSGRSMCYLPALCSLVMGSMAAWNTPGMGPLAVLLADSVANAQTLSNQCNILMAGHDTSMVKVLNTHAQCMEEVHLMLLNSCGILVTTVTHLWQLLRHAIQLIDTQRLKYFIFDDYDRMRSTAPDLLNEVLQLLHNIKIPQLILVAQQWHGRVFHELLKRFGQHHLLLFGDFLEAAVYGGVKINVAVQPSGKKTQQLLDYLANQRPLQRRTLVYCKNEAELKKLQHALTAAGHECIGPSDAANQFRQLLLLTDEGQQSHVSVANYELIVHYSLPESWSKFSYRFHAISNNIANCLAPPISKQDMVSYVMLDESNSNELPRLVQFFNAHHIESNEQLKQLDASCRQLKDHSRPFCPEMLYNGECRQFYCNKRHDAVSEDFQRPICALWQPGTVVRCNLMTIYDPGHFAVMAVSYKDKDSTAWRDASNLSTLRKLSTSLYIHMSCEENCRTKQNLRMSDVCVLRRGGSYQRVRVVDMSDKRLITVQLMDEGTEQLKVKPTELLECDARFIEEPALAMDVRLLGLAPSIGEGDWPAEAKKWVSDVVSGLNDNQHLQLIVEFAMLDVVYAKEMAVVQDCPTMRTCVRVTQLACELIRQGFGKRDEQSIRKLHKLHEKTEMEQRQLTEASKASAAEQEIIELSLEIDNSPEEKIINETIATVNESKLSYIYGLMKRYLKNRVVAVPGGAATSITSDQVQSLHSKEEPNTTTKARQDEADADSVATFIDALLQDLNSDDPSVRAATQHMLHDMLGSDEASSLTTGNLKNTLKNNSRAITESKSKIKLDALYYGVIAGHAVRPKVRWHQTLLQIELIFEQQVPQYQLLHQGNVLIYQVKDTTPIQRCILNLLGEVRILSERQHGYQLHVKLAKQGLNVYWPSLLNSLYAQQHSHWLVYDTERAKPPPKTMAHIHWKRYQRYQYQEKDGDDDGIFSSTDEQNELSDEDWMESDNI